MSMDKITYKKYLPTNYDDDDHGDNDNNDNDDAS